MSNGFKVALRNFQVTTADSKKCYQATIISFSLSVGKHFEPTWTEEFKKAFKPAPDFKASMSKECLGATMVH